MTNEQRIILDESARHAFSRLLTFQVSVIKRLKPLYSEIARIKDKESKEKVAIMLSTLLLGYANEVERLFVSEETKCPTMNEV